MSLWVSPYRNLLRGRRGQIDGLLGSGVGRRFYVDATLGNDAYDGRSRGNAWQTIPRVNGETFRPADRILFKRGETWSGTQLTLDDSGVICSAYGSGANPILKNPGAYGSGTRIIVVQGDYITIWYLKLEDCADHALFLDNATMPDSFSMLNCEITDVGSGVQINGDNTLITRCNIHDLNMIRDDAAPDNDYGAVGVWIFRGDNHEISYNIFNACRAPSTDFGTDGGAIEWSVRDGSIVENDLIHHNHVIDCEGLFETGSFGAVGMISGARIYDNLVVNSKWLTRFNNAGSAETNTIDFLVFYNTFIQTEAVVAGARANNFIDPPSLGDLTLQNNVFYTRGHISTHTGFTHNRNCIYVYDGGHADAGYGYQPDVTEMMEDPLFTNLGGGDYTLQDISPAINIGADLGYTPDYAGNPRPVEAIPDAGTYENQNGYTVPTINYIVDVDHEGGDLSEYDATVGGVSATVGAALNGTNYGMNVNITDQVADYGQVDLSAPASGKLRIRFYVDPNGLTIGAGDDFVIFKDNENQVIMKLRWNGASYLIVNSFQDDDGNWAGWDGPTITDGPHYIEYYITRETADGEDDGRIQQWIDGIYDHDEYFDNFNGFANLSWLRIGAVAEIDVGTSGNFFIDEFKVNDDGYQMGAV